MDIHARAARIAKRLADGELPRTRPVKLWAGFGNGHRACDGCCEVILARDVEHEHDLDGGGVVRFHAACSVLWQRMLTSPAEEE